MESGAGERRVGRGDAVAILALVAVWAAYFWGILSGRGLFFERQFLGQFWAMRADAWAHLFSTGELPLWTPRLFMGMPLLAQANWGLLDPLNLPAFALLDGPEALNFLILADWMIALLGAYALGRGVGLRPAASALGAALMTFTPYALDDAGSLHHAGSRAWAPWAALAYLPRAARGSVPGTA